MIRDFTYVDDIVNSIFKLLKKVPKIVITKKKKEPPLEFLILEATIQLT